MKRTYPINTVCLSSFTAPLLLLASFLSLSTAIGQVLVVGSNSSSQTTNFTSGTNQYSDAYVGYNTGDSNNTVSVVNTNTLLSIAADLNIGISGSSNTLTILSGGTVSNDGCGTLGSNSSSSNNSVIVTDADSSWVNSSDLNIGYDGSGNTLTISNGGMASVAGSNNGIVIGMNADSLNNSALITGTNANGSPSTLTTTMDLFVGSDGSGNNLTISNGGMVTISDLNGNYGVVIGLNADSSNNSILVTGSNSGMTNAHDMIIGNDGSGNNLTISNGATVGSYYLQNFGTVIGFNGDSSNNSVVVTGSNSTWLNMQLIIGENGTGTSASGNSLVISKGGTVSVFGDGYIGFQSAVGNSTLVTDQGSLWTNSGSLYIGYYSSVSNSLTISNGGKVAVAGMGIIGNDASSSNNSVLVTGNGSTWTNSGDLIVGNSGSGNTLTITNGGMVFSDYGFLGYDPSSSNNSAIVSGTNSRWMNNHSLYVGYGGNGTLTVANGGSVVSQNIIISYQGGSVGTLNIGSFGTNDTAGYLSTPYISFGAGPGGTLNFNQSDTTLLTSSITGFGTLQQLGNGTTILGSSNSYSGTTIVLAGSLLLNESNSGSGTITVRGTGTLGGDGSTANTVMIGSGGTLAAGVSGTGILGIGGGLTLQSGSTTVFNIAGTNAFSSLSFSGSSIIYNGNLQLYLGGSYFGTAGDTFSLFGPGVSSLTETGFFSNVSLLGNISSSFLYDGSGDWYATSGVLIYDFSQPTGTLTITSTVPEPSIYGLFVLGVLVIIGVSRRSA